MHRDVRMPCLVVRCLQDMCTCHGCCIDCSVSSSFCPLQRCSDACLSASENGLMSSLQLWHPFPANFSILTSFPVRKDCCCGCCCAASLCCSSLTHCVSCRTCAVNTVISIRSAILRERCVVVACCCYCCCRCGRSLPALRCRAK